MMLAGFIVLCLAVAAVSGGITGASVQTWYVTLVKPAWTPPNAAFGPVWTVLYILIGLSGWLVWRTPRGLERQRALRLWFAQLGLNFIWSPLFFGLHAPGPAAIVIVALWAAIAAYMIFAWRASRAAAILFAPYLTWVAFAAALNIAIWWLNR